MRAVTLELPQPPSANVLWKLNRKTGKPYTNPAYARWKIAALSTMWQQKPAGGFPFFAGAYSVQIVLPLKTRIDADNFAKPLLDFLQKPAGIIANDKHTHEAAITRSAEVNKGFVRLFVFDAPEPIARAA